jgi:deoxyribodipyrimidine photolyase
MKDGDQVESLIGWYWQEGKGHQSCAFSGNYSDIKGNVTFDESKLKAYLDEYIYPVCIMLGDVILQNENATKIEMMDKLSNYKW